MWKRVILLVLLVIAMFFGVNKTLWLANQKSDWSMIAPVAFIILVLCFIWALRKLFSGFFQWVDKTNYEKNYELNKRKISETMPPPPPEPSESSQEKRNNNLY